MKYGIKLLSYRGQASSQWQQMDMWVYGNNGRFETSDPEEAERVADEYRTRNPGGVYDVKLIEE